MTARRLHLALITETYPPEVNGVAMTCGRMVDGLRARGHRVELVRPRQAGDGPGAAASGGPASAAAVPGGDLLVRGLGIPRYPDLKFGLPATGRLLKRWRAERPDLVVAVTEGPLGWSALRAARKLGIPALSEFHTNFHSYSAHYGLGWLERPVRGYLRAFHNRNLATLVPSEDVRARLDGQGFGHLEVVARGVDTGLFDPAKRSAGLRAGWGAQETTQVAIYVGRLAAEKNLPLVLAAFNAMRAIRPDSRLVWVGDGPSAPRCRPPIRTTASPACSAARRWHATTPRATCSCSAAPPRPTATSRSRRWPVASEWSPTTMPPRAPISAIATTASPRVSTTATISSSRPAMPRATRC
nr:glycosyltransferase [Chitinimonas koreensis]